MPTFNGRIRLLLTIAVLVAAGTAHAASGAPVVRVDADEENHAARVRASIVIDAPPSVVWEVLTDCKRTPKIIPNLESCRIVKRDAQGRWDIREHVINPTLLPRMRTVVRNDYQHEQRLRFRRVSGDMRISRGEWRLQAMTNAKATRLIYDALIAPDFFVPQFLIARAVQFDFPNVLRAIERASVSDAAGR